MKRTRRASHLTLTQYTQLIGDQLRQMLKAMDEGLVTPVYFVDGKVLTRPQADV